MRCDELQEKAWCELYSELKGGEVDNEIGNVARKQGILSERSRYTVRPEYKDTYYLIVYDCTNEQHMFFMRSQYYTCQISRPPYKNSARDIKSALARWMLRSNVCFVQQTTT
jgi:hypothetical protein